MTVAKPEMAALTLRPGFLAAFYATIFLHYALLWVATAGCIVMVIVRRVLGEVEGAPVLSAVYSVTVYSLTSGLLLLPVVLMLIAVRINNSDGKDSRKDIEEPLETPRQTMRTVLKDPIMIGAFVVIAFVMLILAGDLLVGQSPLKGSQRAQVGSILMDVGKIGAGAANCFIILPAVFLRQCRMK